jgi:hypothetical protein
MLYQFYNILGNGAADNMLKGWTVMDGSIPSLTTCGWYHYESKV